MPDQLVPEVVLGDGGGDYLDVDSLPDVFAPEPPAPEQVEHGPLGTPATLFVGLVAALGLACFGFFVIQLEGSDLAGLALITALAAAGTRFNVTVYGETRVDISFVALFAVALLYGAPGMVVAGPLVAASLHGLRGIPSLRYLFDTGNVVVAGTAGALTFHAISGPPFEDITPLLLVAAGAAALVTYVANTYLVDQVAAMTTGRSVWAVWNEKDRWLLPHYMVLGFLGLALAVAYDVLGVFGLLAFVAPPAMMQFSIRQYIERTTENVGALRRKNDELEAANSDILEMTKRLGQTYQGTLEALVSALDARDRETKGHSSRVSTYTMDIARDLGIPRESQEWVDIQRGALLHDVGKIGVTDFILHKPGPLSPEEWHEMRRHPQIGFEMLKAVSFLQYPAEIVHAHHERYDGKGYPLGLAAEEIPLGARIFAVADTFDAMMSDRPYRRAAPPEAVREEIIRCSGTQFDPRVVEAFLRVFDKWVAQDERMRVRRKAA